MTDVVYLSKEESAAADGDFDNDAEYDDEYDDTYDDNAVGQEEPGVQFKGHLELRVLICDKYMDIRNRALQVQTSNMICNRFWVRLWDKKKCIELHACRRRRFGPRRREGVRAAEGARGRPRAERAKGTIHKGRLQIFWDF